MPPLILVVEDEAPVRRVTCRYLEDAGFDCLDAAHPAHALKLLAAGAIPNLMVLDVRLPDIPGPALALRIHRLLPNIPVLFVSGWIDRLADPDTLSPLRWEFLQKPFTGEALVARVRQLLSSS